DDVAFRVADLARMRCGAVRAVEPFGDAAGRTRHVAALAEHAAAVFVRKLDEVVIEDLAVVRAGAYEAAALSLCVYRITLLHPVGHVDVVDVLLGDVVAAEPVKVVPVTHLVLHLGLAGLPGIHPHAVLVPVYAAED